MQNLDLFLRRCSRRLREVLPGQTNASRLAKRGGHWRHLPPHQQAAAYAQFLQAQRQLREFHLQSKILPKLIDVVFRGLVLHLRTELGGLMILLILLWMFGFL